MGEEIGMGAAVRMVWRRSNTAEKGVNGNNKLAIELYPLIIYMIPTDHKHNPINNKKKPCQFLSQGLFEIYSNKPARYLKNQQIILG